jgi:nucleotide sugar dehydrogenase
MINEQNTKQSIKIGFIGQGFIGKNYSDDFEARGYKVTRYAKDAPYDQNKEALKSCDVVFIAVPTPTTPEGFDLSIIRSVIPLTNIRGIVVIKSTLLPGSTRALQFEFADRIILHSPEFLSEATAAYDAAHPFSNIIGIPENSTRHIEAASLVHSLLPSSPFTKTVTSDEAEIIKYTHNCAGYMRILFFNIMYDFSQKFNVDWQNIKDAMKADPYIGDKYAEPVHKTGRGAGGHCFIKDFAAFSRIYKDMVGDYYGVELLRIAEEKNKDLLRRSEKDLDLLLGVYGNANAIKYERRRSLMGA